MNKKKILKITLLALGIIFLVILVLILTVPFLVPVAPAENTKPAKELASENSNFITIPYDGTDGIDIHYFYKESQAATSSPTFVLLHGSMFNSFTWDKTIDSFSKYGNVLAYDQIPYGLSEKLLEGDWSEDNNPYTTDAAVDQLFLLLDELNIENVILVGNSYGGNIAVQAAITNPERVDSLILIEPAVYVKEELPSWFVNIPQVDRLGPLFARMFGESEAFTKSTYLNPETLSEERMQKTLIHSNVNNWDYALWEYLQVWGDKTDYADRFSEIKQSVLIVSGDSENIVPVEDSKKLDSVLDNSSLVVISLCGHIPQEECPDDLMSEIDEWIK